MSHRQLVGSVIECHIQSRAQAITQESTRKLSSLLLTIFIEKLLHPAGKIQETECRSPNTNAYLQRFIQTLQQECLDHFVVFGEQHMDYLVQEFVKHYHEERPHQSKDNDILTPSAMIPAKESKADSNDSPRSEVAGIDCHQRLGGLLKHYRRIAA